jgi:rhodanese-related sulfurtransferase
MQSIPAISAAELYDKFLAGEPMIVLDVRTPEEYHEERLPIASALLPHVDLPVSHDQLPEDHTIQIFTFCHSGQRSDFAAMYLRSLGYRNSFSVTGGIVAWKAAGFATVCA